MCEVYVCALASGANCNYNTQWWAAGRNRKREIDTVSVCEGDMRKVCPVSGCPVELGKFKTIGRCPDRPPARWEWAGYAC